MRIGVVDIGSNSTRLLVARVAGDRVDELERRSTVTRLGQGVEATGALAEEAIERVLGVLDEYRRAMDAHAVERTVGVLTSAVRDASNGAAFTEQVRDRYGVDARTIPGAEEARLTFLGATSERPAAGEPQLVIDIGGGSTEVVVGRAGAVSFFTSLQAGVVRHGERHLHDDPPTREQLEALRDDIARLIEREVPADVRRAAGDAIAVAGTATQSAAIDLGLEPYDPSRVHGHVLGRARLEQLLDELAGVPLAERRRVRGLDPDRAPVIVPGMAMLLCCLEAFGLDHVEVSEHDILRGAALEAAGSTPG